MTDIDKLNIGAVEEDGTYYKVAYYRDHETGKITDVFNKKTIDEEKIVAQVPMGEIIETLGMEDIDLFRFRYFFFEDCTVIYNNSDIFGADLVDIGYKGKQGYLQYKKGPIPYEYFKALEKVIALPKYTSIASRVSRKVNKFVRKRKKVR